MSEINKIKIAGETYSIQDITARQKIEEILNNDYTAFEVFAHDYDIPTGICAELNNSELFYQLPAEMTHQFTIRSQVFPQYNDVVIDWGDGSEYTKLSQFSVDNLTGSQENWNYTISHTYSNNGKYIIKIYGKEYFGLIQSPNYQTNNRTKNILCRVFDKDLPIASHIRNLSSFARFSNHLTKVYAYNCTSLHNNTITNMAICFSGCRNLQSVEYFPNLSYYTITTQMFQGCHNLISTNIVCFKNVSLYHMFRYCRKLKIDVGNFFKKFQVISGNSINMKGLFQDCSEIYGTVPANKLWENTNVIWTNTSTCFTGCSDEIRSQVPVSWGGTNENINAKLSIKNDNDYTAFEVFAHDYDIPTGVCEELNNSEIFVPLPAEMRHKFLLRSEALPDMQDVVVDWGDGNVTSLKDTDTADVGGSEGDWKYTLEHTYNTTGKYIIKIYGKEYFAIISSPVFNGSNPDPNIICRIFDRDLPIASHLRNLSSFARYSHHLTSIYAFNCPSLHNNAISNFAISIANCYNLQSVEYMPLPKPYSTISQYFQGNKNLKTITSFYPTIHSTLYATFDNCENLEFDISKILEKFSPVKDSTINVGAAFSNCKKMYGTVPANKLWNNKDVTWKNTSTCFFDCSDEIRAQVPKSWGGTASNDIIEKSFAEKYNQLLSRIENLQSSINNS